MRLGNNPNKGKTIAPLSRVVVLVITHLPEMESDYHRGRAAIIEKSLDTLRLNSLHNDYSLVIWDNGSEKSFQEYLLGWRPDQLILSRNIGKTNALKSIMRMLPPDTILAYGDDDIEYMPNWLAPQIEILETYPNVGTVTGWPVRVTGTWGVDTPKTWETHDGHKDGETFERGRFIPDEWERDYCESVGRDWDGYKALTWGVQDVRITYHGVQAYAMSQHCQFVCYPERVEPLIEWTDRVMQDEIPWDKAVDIAGLLRLSTVERYTRHLGNVLVQE